MWAGLDGCSPFKSFKRRYFWDTSHSFTDAPTVLWQLGVETFSLSDWLLFLWIPIFGVSVSCLCVLVFVHWLWSSFKGYFYNTHYLTCIYYLSTLCAFFFFFFLRGQQKWTLYFLSLHSVQADVCMCAGSGHYPVALHQAMANPLCDATA